VTAGDVDGGRAAGLRGGSMGCGVGPSVGLGVGLGLFCAPGVAAGGAPRLSVVRGEGQSGA
jgi:hypothetical protein